MCANKQRKAKNTIVCRRSPVRMILTLMYEAFVDIQDEDVISFANDFTSNKNNTVNFFRAVTFVF